MTLHADVRLRRGGFELDVDITIPAGQTVALLGPNGAGKSTLVAILAGLVPPDQGIVALDHLVLDDAGLGIHLPPQDRPVGIMFQDLLLFPHLSVLENVAFPMRARRVPRREAHDRATELLARLGVADRANAQPSRLSGGEAQRVALARALIHEPRLLLLDEPLAALDVQARERIRGLVRTTLAGFDGVRILITHDPVEAMMLADRLVLLDRGRVTQVGTPDEIRLGPRTPYAADLVGVNLFTGRLVPAEDGAGRLETPGGDVIVAWPPEVEGAVEGVVGLVRPADVSLFLAEPAGSARNVVRGPIESITIDGDRGRVRIASSPTLVAEVTSGSVTRLGLQEGMAVWASFKAVEVTILLP